MFVIFLCSIWYVRWYCSIVFFFKQKTSYELRISDWNSDVCSSDLVFQVQAYLEFFQYTNVGRSAALLMVLWAITFALSNVFIKQWLKLRERAHGELGRASRRERVCQYV